jgi:hypothetical protein
MNRYLVALCTAGIYFSASGDTSAQAASFGRVRANPSIQVPVALVVDARGLEWCDGAICFRTVRVLGVIRNQTGYEVPDKITITHDRGTSSVTTGFLFLRIWCGTGNPLWQVLPANEPTWRHESRIMASFWAG